jgi:small conductance mechanosensitive channel
VGDYVLTGDTEGTVKEIGLTHTQIDTLDNKLVFVPNSELSAGKITNFSAEEKRMVELRFNASYDAPADEVYRALRDVMDSVPGFLQDPAPLINISAYGTSSIEYLFRGWVKNADYWPAYFQTLDEVKRMFDARGIKMTYDHINVHMMGGNDDE